MNAEKMFEKLGYKKYKETEKFLCYENYSISPFDFEGEGFEEWKNRIEFDLRNKIFAIYTHYEDDLIITMDLLNAINKKCKELGWLNEEES